MNYQNNVPRSLKGETVLGILEAKTHSAIDEDKTSGLTPGDVGLSPTGDIPKKKRRKKTLPVFVSEDDFEIYMEVGDD